MKSFHLLLGIFCVCFSSLFSQTSLALSLFSKSETPTITVLDPFVDMRTGPGRGYPVFHVVEKNDRITILKRKTTWYKAITEDGKTGWISRATLENTVGPNGDIIEFSEPSREDYLNRRWEIGVLGGNISGATAITNYGAFHWTRNISTEIRYTESFGNVSSARLISANLLHHPFPNWKLSPFFVLGSGTFSVSPRSSLVQSVDRKDNILSVGGGFNYYLTARLSVRLEYNRHTALTSRETNEEVEEWKAGFSVFF